MFIEPELFVQDPYREFRILGFYKTRNLYLRSANRHDIYPMFREGAEHLSRHARMRPHADAHYRDLGKVVPDINTFRSEIVGKPLCKF